MPASEAHDWRLFDAVEPIGHRETWHLLAIMCARTYNRWRAEGEAPLSPKDFLIRTAEEAKERTQEVAETKKSNMIEGLVAIATAQKQRAGNRPPRRRKKARK